MFANAVQLNNLYENEAELDHALVMRLKALKINRQLNSRDGMADDCRRLGILFAMRGQLRRAIRLLRRALELERDLNRPRTLADACFNLAAVYAARNQGENACRFFQEALSIDEHEHNVPGRIHDHLALSETFFQRNAYHEARTHLDAGLELQRRYKDNRAETGDLLASIAGQLLTRFQAIAALKILERAGGIYAQCDTPHGMAEITALSGVAHHLAGDTKEAESLLQKAIYLNRALNRIVREADSCANLATLYWAGGRREEAERLYRQALVLFDKGRCQDQSARIRQMLNDLLTQQREIG